MFPRLVLRKKTLLVNMVNYIYFLINILIQISIHILFVRCLFHCYAAPAIPHSQFA